MKNKYSKPKSESSSKTASKNPESKSKPEEKSSKKATQGGGDIASLILRDHKPLKDLIQTLKDPEITFTKKRPAFSQFEQLLTCHAKAEEESLYIYLKELKDLRIEGIEGDTEHAIAERLMSEIKSNKNDEDAWMAKMKVLAEVVEHHIEEEEILKKVRKEFKTSMRAEIGERYGQLLSKYRDEFKGHSKLNGRDEMRADHV